MEDTAVMQANLKLFIMQLSQEDLIRVLNYVQELRTGKIKGNSCGHCFEPLAACICDNVA